MFVVAGRHFGRLQAAYDGPGEGSLNLGNLNMCENFLNIRVRIVVGKLLLLGFNALHFSDSAIVSLAIFPCS